MLASCPQPPRAPPWGINAHLRPRQKEPLAHGLLQEGPTDTEPEPSSRQKPVLGSRGDLEGHPRPALSQPVHCSRSTPATQHRVNLCKRGATLQDGSHSKDVRAWEVGARELSRVSTEGLGLSQVQGWRVGKSLKQTWNPEAPKRNQMPALQEPTHPYQQEALWPERHTQTEGQPDRGVNLRPPGSWSTAV